MEKPWGFLYVPEFVIVPQDGMATVNNIIAGETIFRLSIMAALVVQIGHIFIPLLLYRLLSPANKTLAIYMVVFMLVSIPITMLNELNNFAILYLVNGNITSTVVSPEQIGNWVLFFHSLHETGIFIAEIFWGLWLIPMGWLIIKSELVPKLLGYALLIVALSYVADFFMGMLLPQLGIEITGVVGFLEILFPLWLLIKGVDAEKWQVKEQHSVV
ncbi:MAG: DUF4386 domain-containing protein [Ardenticatenaceae bacterium]|nr:DUF4386 domain-containing protein [Ardenticatenaceae bacterium]